MINNKAVQRPKFYVSGLQIWWKYKAEKDFLAMIIHYFKTNCCDTLPFGIVDTSEAARLREDAASLGDSLKKWPHVPLSSQSDD